VVSFDDRSTTRKLLTIFRLLGGRFRLPFLVTGGALWLNWLDVDFVEVYSLGDYWSAFDYDLHNYIDHCFAFNLYELMSSFLF